VPAQQLDADLKLLADVRAKAEKGDAESQRLIGGAFHFGHLGVAKDDVEAAKWYLKAAEQGLREAQLFLGMFYAEGLGVAKDEVEGAKWLRKAAEQNLADAQFLLGLFCAEGRGVTKDEAEGVTWLRKAAEQNLAPAQYVLGSFYFHGEGVAKDEVEAVKWFRKAADKGLREAQYFLGYCYDRGLGVTRDYVEAAKWYRKAAEQNDAEAQFGLSDCYVHGRGVTKNEMEGVKWLRKAAEQNLARAQYNLAFHYQNGEGVEKDEREAVKRFRKAAERSDAAAQLNLGVCHVTGQGVAKDEREAVKWFRKAAEQNGAEAQCNLARCYITGEGVAKDYVGGYKWSLLAAGQGIENAKALATMLERRMTREQIAEGQKLARDFKPRGVPSVDDTPSTGVLQTRPESSGTGFFITEDGYLITNEHVAGNGAQVRLVSEAGLIYAKVVKVDAANDLTLLKAEGKFAALAVVSSRTARMGSTVATVGFPNIGLQGFAPKLAKGEIAALSGTQDDPRFFQISVPVQPGNSGGALVDERGNVVGVVAAKLNAAAAMATSGALPENVNYAIKSSFLLSFLESVPDLADNLKEPNAKDRKFEDVVKSAEQAAVLVLVY